MKLLLRSRERWPSWPGHGLCVVFPLLIDFTMRTLWGGASVREKRGKHHSKMYKRWISQWVLCLPLVSVLFATFSVPGTWYHNPEKFLPRFLPKCLIRNTMFSSTGPKKPRKKQGKCRAKQAKIQKIKEKQNKYREKRGQTWFSFLLVQKNNEANC